MPFGLAEAAVRFDNSPAVGQEGLLGKNSKSLNLLGYHKERWDSQREAWHRIRNAQHSEDRLTAQRSQRADS